MRLLLISILALATGGLVFSGYLSYRELFATPAAATCTPLGQSGGVLGAPPCIYGFVMYLAIVVVAAIATITLVRHRDAH
jgi:uncharacterized membrane protein